MDPLTALAQAFDHTHGIVAGIQFDQLSNATPCAQWDVAALLGHTLGVVAGIGAAVRGDAPAGEGMGFTLCDDLAGQFRAIADGTLAAWQAADLGGEVNIGAGPMPGNVALGINLLDTSTHAWDLARAPGQPDELPEELAETVLTMCQGFVTDEIRGLAGFAPAVEVSAEATTTTRLAAFLGRQP